MALKARKKYLNSFKIMFECLDANGDNFINLNEWKDHNSAMGISSVHAESFLMPWTKMGVER